MSRLDLVAASVTSRVEKVPQTFRKCRRITGIFSRGSMGVLKWSSQIGNASGSSGSFGDSRPETRPSEPPKSGRKKVGFAYALS
jgi:hypothetical protein